VCLTSEFIVVSVFIIALVIALFLILIGRNSNAVDTKSVIKNYPWDIVFFSVEMYVVVYALGNAGLTSALSNVLETMAEQSLFITTIGMGFIAAFLSSIMNNMPTVMVDALAIAETSTSGV